jgi:hypothetical protein
MVALSQIEPRAGGEEATMDKTLAILARAADLPRRIEQQRKCAELAKSMDRVCDLWAEMVLAAQAGRRAS